MKGLNDNNRVSNFENNDVTSDNTVENKHVMNVDDDISLRRSTRIRKPPDRLDL